MAVFKISDDDSLYTVVFDWGQLLDYFHNPRKTLARARVMGETRQIVRFEYGITKGFRGDVLLQGTESKVYQTAFVNSGSSKGVVQALNQSTLKAAQDTVQSIDVTVRLESGLAFTHIKLDPKTLSDPWLQWLIAKNPRLVIEALCLKVPHRIQHTPTGSFVAAKKGEIKRNPKHLANPKWSSAPYVVEVGQSMSPGCCTCAIVTSKCKLVDKGTKNQTYVLTDLEYAFTTYCPCTPMLSTDAATLI